MGEPYIALILALDLGVVRSLCNQVADADLPEASPQTLSVWQADPKWLGPLTRYAELTRNTMDTQVLGPSILREIHYRLLLSPIGGMLRRMMTADSHANRIAKAIQMLRNEFRTSISMAELADWAGMSTSSFHTHFKAVTSTTPLQYQKALRLIAARTLLVQDGRSVTDTAYAVGYESPTHFSRDYSKKFGLPPSLEGGQTD